MKGKLKLKTRIENCTIPVLFYGEDDDEVLLVATFSDEVRLNWIERLLTGYNYSYHITITE